MFCRCKTCLHFIAQETCSSVCKTVFSVAKHVFQLQKQVLQYIIQTTCHPLPQGSAFAACADEFYHVACRKAARALLEGCSQCCKHTAASGATALWPVLQKALAAVLLQRYLLNWNALQLHLPSAATRCHLCCKCTATSAAERSCCSVDSSAFLSVIYIIEMHCKCAF